MLIVRRMSLTRFQASDCELSISELDGGRLLIALEGRDLGQLGRRPFEDLEGRMGTHPALHLWFDLRRATGATLEASSRWAIWLRRHRRRLSRVDMLTSRPVITLSAKTVQRFAELGDSARIYAGVAPLKFW